MSKYEVMFIINPQLEEEAINSLLKKLEEIIRREGGEVTDLNKWGKRKLAYEIKGVHEGYYVILMVKGKPPVISELEHQMKVADEIIRYLVVKLEEEGEEERLSHERGEVSAE